MRPQLNYYKKKDFRVYKKLNKSYEKVKNDVRNIDSTYKSISKLLIKISNKYLS